MNKSSNSQNALVEIENASDGLDEIRLDPQTLIDVMASLGSSITAEQVQRMHKCVDRDCVGNIAWTDFVKFVFEDESCSRLWDEHLVSEEEYLQRHNIFALFGELSSRLAKEQPADPFAWLKVRADSLREIAESIAKRIKLSDTSYKLIQYNTELAKVRGHLEKKGRDDLLFELEDSVIKVEEAAADLKLKLTRIFQESLKAIAATPEGKPGKAMMNVNEQEVSMDLSELSECQQLSNASGDLEVSTFDEGFIDKLKQRYDIPEGWVLISASVPPNQVRVHLRFGTVYIRARDQLGGEKAIAHFAPNAANIAHMVTSSTDYRQDPAFQALTVRELYASGMRKLPILTSIFSKMKAYIEEQFPDVRVEVLVPPMKGAERAGDKALMKYGGDVTRLRDLVRGSLIVHTNDIGIFYEILELLAAMPLMKQEACHWSSFEDRFQVPMSEGYCDTQWLACIFGFLCEVQITIGIFHLAKTVGHLAYEDFRRKIESLLMATIRELPALSLQLLQTGANPNQIRDKHGLRPLHFAAMLGHERTVRALLKHQANPFSEDQNGRWPLHRAVLEGHPGIVSVLIEAMESQDRFSASTRSPNFEESCTRLQETALELLDEWKIHVLVQPNEYLRLEGSLSCEKTLVGDLMLRGQYCQRGWKLVTDLGQYVDSTAPFMVEFSVHNCESLMEKLMAITDRALSSISGSSPVDNAVQKKSEPLLTRTLQLGYSLRKMKRDLGSKDKDHRQTAMMEFAWLCNASTPLAKRLFEDDDWKVRASVAKAIGMFPPNVSWAAELIPLLDDVWDVQLQAVKSLGLLGETAAEFAPELARMMQDEDTDTQGEARRSLAKMGSKTVEPHVHVLAEGFESEVVSVREATAWAFQCLDADVASQCVGQLVARLEDESPWVQLEAVRSLGCMGAKAAPYAANLANMLPDMIRKRCDGIIVGDAVLVTSAMIDEYDKIIPQDVRGRCIEIEKDGTAGFDFGPKHGECWIKPADLGKLMEPPLQQMVFDALSQIGAQGLEQYCLVWSTLIKSDHFVGKLSGRAQDEIKEALEKALSWLGAPAALQLGQEAYTAKQLEIEEVITRCGVYACEM